MKEDFQCLVFPRKYIKLLQFSECINCGPIDFTIASISWDTSVHNIVPNFKGYL